MTLLPKTTDQLITWFRPVVVCAVSFWGVFVFAQNRVPNPSFEEIANCPNTVGQLFKAAHWHKGGVGSPDLFNTCDGSDTCGAPQNFFGFQAPATGDGYCGMWAYSKASSGYGTHEIIGARLSEPLTIGGTYWASIKVSWTSSYPSPLVLTRYATDKMGILMKMDSTFGESRWLPWPDRAHVYTEHIISDSVNWTVIQGHFVADSAYRFIYIGNFFGDDLTDTLAVDPSGNTDISYYYVDDVCLSADPADCDVDIGIHPLARDMHLHAWLDGNGSICVRGVPNGTRAVIDMFDARGRLLFSRSSLVHGDVLSVSAASLSPGPHILQLTTDLTGKSFTLIVPNN